MHLRCDSSQTAFLLGWAHRPFRCSSRLSRFFLFPSRYAFRLLLLSPNPSNPFCRKCKAQDDHAQRSEAVVEIASSALGHCEAKLGNRKSCKPSPSGQFGKQIQFLAQSRECIESSCRIENQVLLCRMGKFVSTKLCASGHGIGANVQATKLVGAVPLILPSPPYSCPAWLSWPLLTSNPLKTPK